MLSLYCSVCACVKSAIGSLTDTHHPSFLPPVMLFFASLPPFLTPHPLFPPPLSLFPVRELTFPSKVHYNYGPINRHIANSRADCSGGTVKFRLVTSALLVADVLKTPKTFSYSCKCHYSVITSIACVVKKKKRRRKILHHMPLVSVSFATLHARTASKANLPHEETPRLLNFRNDLDYKQQEQSVAAFHQIAADDLNVIEWKKTMLHRKDHYAMVMMLFGEAMRHNPTRFTTAEKKDIVGKLKLMMGEGQRRDCYVDALHYLVALRVF